MKSKSGTSAYAILLAAPILLFVVLFIFPLGLLVLNSFYSFSRTTGMGDEFTLANYQDIFRDNYYLSSLLRTMRMAVLTALVALVIGYPVALYSSAASPRKRAWITIAIISPLLVSVMVRTFGWIIIFGRGGLIDASTVALFGVNFTILHTEAAAIAGMANVFMPFLALAVMTSLQSIDPSIPLAAASLGANPWRTFLYAVLPLTLPGVLAGFLIVFSLSASSFVLPSLLGGQANKTLSMLIYQQTIVLLNWPFAAALAVVLVSVVLALAWLQTHLIERGRYRSVFN